MQSLIGGVPPGFGEASFYLIVAASFFSSFLTSAFGVGGGVVLLAILAGIIQPGALIPIHGVVQLGSNLGRTLMLLRSVHLSSLPSFAIGSVAGCLMGGLVSIDLPPYAVQMGVGAFILWTIFSSPPKWLTRWPALTGVLSSILTMFFGATGPFVASYTRSLNLVRQPYVSTTAALMSVQHAIKIFVFGFLGFAFGPWLIVLALMIASGVLGTLCGQLVLGRMSDKLFVKILNASLILISLQMIIEGFIQFTSIPY